MSERHPFLDTCDAEPTYQFDGRFVVNERVSPLCNVKLWLPIDCHDDAVIQVVAQDFERSPSKTSINIESSSSRLVSEIRLESGFKIEAENLHIRSQKTKHGLKLNNTTVTIDHISCLRLRRETPSSAEKSKNSLNRCNTILFRLSDLKYGQPFSAPITSHLGNRKVKIFDTRILPMHTSSRVIHLELQKHWEWRDAKFGRLIASSTPTLVISDSKKFNWDSLEEVQKIGRDACLLLTLAARHLTVMHVMVAATDRQHQEEWFSPLKRQRSTTEEEANGPLVDASELESYFSIVSERWLSLTEQQKDSVRLAVYSVNPFQKSSLEGNFLRMFSALDGLAKTWFPHLQKICKKIPALLDKFPTRYVGLWPLTNSKKDGLDAIRNLIAHGKVIRGEQMEALIVGSDHLQVWIERILLSILGFIPENPPNDWLTRHVTQQVDDLHRLRAAIRSASTDASSSVQ